MTQRQHETLAAMKAAKQLAWTLPAGTMQRATNPMTQAPSIFLSFHAPDGRRWVLDSSNTIKNPDAVLEVNGDIYNARLIL